MVKLTEVEDEHFAQEKPQPSKHNVLLASDDEDDDYTDTGTSLPPTYLPTTFILFTQGKKS
jgi:import receptor subunit TOM22